MTTFVALYRGTTIADARLIAVSVDPALAGELATRMLDRQSAEPELERNRDPILSALEAGRRSALDLVRSLMDRDPANVA